VTELVLRQYVPGYEVGHNPSYSGWRYYLVRLSDNVVLARCKTRGPLERIACPVWDGMPDTGLAIMRR
jgi:hypothetical protein